MPELTPEEKNEIINQIHGLVESLREDPHGIQIGGCRGVVGLLLVVGILLLVGYVVLSFSGQTRSLIVGVIVGTAGLFLVMYFLVQATR